MLVKPMSTRPKTYEEALSLLEYYLHEREKIRLAKLGDSHPTSSDPILKKYRFTNVLRAHDRTTQWGVENIYKPLMAEDAGAEIILLNAGIFRYFGTTDFFKELGIQRDFQPEVIIGKAREMRARGQKVFTSAYVITNGGISLPKEEVVVNHYIRALYTNIPEILGNYENKFEIYAKRMYQLKGFGGTGFMTKEVLSDVLLSGVVDFTDKYEWSPVGPGALRGLGWMFPNSRHNIPKGDKAVPLLRMIAKDLKLEPWMPQFGKELDLHGIQFAMCELDKYARTLYDGGAPKAIYKPYF
jgi:hypothetical protein